MSSILTVTRVVWFTLPYLSADSRFRIMRSGHRQSDGYDDPHWAVYVRPWCFILVFDGWGFKFLFVVVECARCSWSVFPGSWGRFGLKLLRHGCTRQDTHGASRESIGSLQRFLLGTWKHKCGIFIRTLVTEVSIPNPLPFLQRSVK